MRPLGFSTGALAKGDFQVGIEMQRPHGAKAIELSALRPEELSPLIRAVGVLQLDDFEHVSFHAPSRLNGLAEGDVIALLSELPLSWPIILHPDIVVDPQQWRFLGERLCLENMDQRKPKGRTVAEMEQVFRELPDASFCCDIGHARQVDPTMGVAIGLLQRFRDRLKQIHISEVDPHGKHIPISFAASYGFRLVAKLIPESCPIIIESMVKPEEMPNELEVARQALSIEVRVENLPVASL
ncbi:MAG TPA: hypothetical protein VNM67_06460 [Thermoanaerobaculia bacterium]|jgi:hypothetical protein|nr:hypothetical protein [Thermoanaerobaculia bacterium]